MKFTEGSFMIPVSCAESFGHFVHVQTEPCVRSVGVPPAALQVGAAVWGAENTVTFGSRAASTRQSNCSAMTAGPPTTRCGIASSITVINWSGDTPGTAGTLSALAVHRRCADSAVSSSCRSTAV